MAPDALRTQRGPSPRGDGPAHVKGVVRQSDATFFAMADFLLAAWFWWMTPLLTALSSFFEAVLRAPAAASLSPEAVASRTLRTHVRSSLLTALLRSVRVAFVLMRLSCDLMFATLMVSFVRSDGCR